MDISELNTDAAAMGGQWRQLKTKSDGVIEGRVLSYEKREKTFEGEVVLNRKTKQPRWEWVFVLQVEGEDDPVKIGLNESAQRAIANALREAGASAKVGDTLKIAVADDPEDDRSQATYRAKWTPNAAPLDLSAYDDTEEPF